MVARAAYQFLIDWKGNGINTDAADDVTARTLDQRTPITIRYGRDQARQLSPPAPGELSFEIDNTSRDYSPENAASPLAGYVAPGRHVQFQGTWTGGTTILYCGYLDDFDIRPGTNDRSVPGTCLDTLGRFRGQTLTTSLYQGIRTGDAIGYVLDAAGWPASARDLDIGVSYLPFWWLDSTDAFQALTDLLDSEGSAALLTIDGNGNVVFRDRHHRLTRSASLTAQATWRSSGIEPVISDPLVYGHGWKEIVNSLSVDVPVRTIDFNITNVWTSEGPVSIPAASTITITAHAGSPFINAVTPEQDTDYSLISGDATVVGISRTSGQSTDITISSSGGGVISDLALRGQAINSTSVVISVEDTPSVGKYGRKSQGSGLPVWANQYDALAILTLIVAKRAERLPTITVTMRGNGNPLRLAECFTRDLSDRVHLTESLTGLDSDCFIEQISHTITAGGAEHVTTFGLEKIPPTVSNPFTFDVSGQGFDQGLFDTLGTDNPATMFRFDVAGQGFDQGVFSY